MRGEDKDWKQPLAVGLCIVLGLTAVVSCEIVAQRERTKQIEVACGAGRACSVNLGRLTMGP